MSGNGESMNNIFIKNLDALSTKNPDLAKRLETHILTDVPQLVQENDAYNFLYKNVYLHNRQNPLQEANEIFAMAENSPIAIHLVFGIGLGYLFQVACLKSQGTIILLESDLNILQVAFTLVDFSVDILRKNVYITDNLEQASEYLYKKSGNKNTPLLLSTTAYQTLEPEKFSNLVDELKKMIGTFTLNLKYTKERYYSLTKNFAINIPYLINEIPFAEFQDRCKGKAAVVVSAGPTLDRNIETLKKYRDKYILFVVGTAAKTILSHGLKPDFLCIIEGYDSSKQIQGLDLEDINFITEPYSNNNLRKFNFKNTFTHVSANLPINHLWQHLTDINIEEYCSKGTVSYTALNCARILGCSKIILVGQDLAYIEGQCYSKDSAYKDLKCTYNKEFNRWEILAENFDNFCASLSNDSKEEVRVRVAQERLKNLNNSLFYVKGINGDMILTESVYATFIEPLTEYAEHFNDREYINTSLVGAQIDGFKNMPLEEALKDAELVGEFNLSSDFKYDVEKLKSRLSVIVAQLKSSFKLIEEGNKIIKNLNNNLKRGINVDTLKELKKLIANYLTLSSDFSKQVEIFDFITTSERIDLDYEMKMTKEFTVDSVNNIVEKVARYLKIASARVNVIIGLLEKTCG